MFKHVLAVVTTMLLSTQAAAWAIKPFTTGEFEHLKKNNKPVLVHVHAVWCPTCSQQTLKLDRILAKETYEDLTILRLNFDSQKDLAKQLKAVQQSVMIMYKGNSERMRSVADTNPDNIKSMLDVGTR